MSETEKKPVAMDSMCTCLFCGKSFPVRDIVFAIDQANGNADQKDEKFEATMNGYKLVEGSIAVEAPYRRCFEKWNEEDVGTCEEGPDGMRIPLNVNVDLSSEPKYRKKRGLLYDDTEETGEAQATIRQKAATRICPYCHLTLPKGFATEQVRRIGLVGGSRCGKTTYMVVACKYLKSVFGRMGGGLDLGTVEFVQESQKYLDSIYNSQRNATGAVGTPVDDGDADRPVFPIVTHIVPTDTRYAPFYLVFQDIPGEYMKKENANKLINSPIPYSTDLVSLVDINSLMETRMVTEKKYGDVCMLLADELFDNFISLGDELKSAGKLKTVQICVTKLDFWIDADEDAGRTALFASPTDQMHKEKIDDGVLEMISQQVREKLSRNVAGIDQSELLEAMLQSMGMDDTPLEKAYTAVASRVIPGNENIFENGGEIDFKHSLNVLQPILNITRWADLLPHGIKEQPVAQTETAEPERTSIFKKIFGIFRH